MILGEPDQACYKNMDEARECAIGGYLPEHHIETPNNEFTGCQFIKMCNNDWGYKNKKFIASHISKEDFE